ncbi:hypothetical protein HPB47_014814 [Ixodes persulcatus]|uniref:Uncharacterized protein n=1 Tax=Ixodes persulcatus TaxID=34615 RepID=A0AC60QV30_IXOPE|nr:hypothetical protein HPB47_014814 [Ixodes persulcatus]
MSVECLAIYGSRKKVITVHGDHKLKDVRNALLQSDFRELVKPTLLVQVYNSTYEEYVDVSDSYVIKVHDKLNLVVEELQPSTSSAAPPVAPVSVASSSIFHSTLPTLSYTLPELTLDLQELLPRVEEGKVSNALRQRIIRWLHSDLCRYALYPGKRDLYSEAARHLVFKYPQLADKPGFGFGSWKEALKNRTKNQRRRMLDVKEVADERAKRARACLSGGSQTPRGSSRPSVTTTLALYDVGEDEASIAAHTEYLKKEMRKTPESRNEEMISDAMKRTYVKRRGWISEKPRTVEEVLDLYPALGVKEEVLQEFLRMTGVHAEDGVRNFFETKGERVEELLKAKQGKAGAAAVSFEVTSPAMEIIKGLAALLKDSAACLVQKEVDHLDPPAFPVIRVREKTSSQAAAFTVQLEDSSFEVTDIVTGTALVLALYWVHDISYCPRTSRSLAVIGHFIGLKYKIKSVLVLDVITKLC